jgi:site-specific DNA-methyltransferase (cytosine-N4-specific)
LLSKQAKYYYDAAAIRTKLADKTYTTFGSERKRLTDDPLIAAGNISRDLPIRKPKSWKMPDGWNTGAGAHGSFHPNGREKESVQINSVVIRDGMLASMIAGII